MTGVADHLSRGAGFASSPDWFAAWDPAYARAPLDVAGVPVMDERAWIGPVAYRLRRSRTNPHTAVFAPDPAGVTAEALLEGADVVRLDYLPEGSTLLAAARGWADARIAPHALAPVAECRGSYADWLARRSKRARQRWRGLERQAVDELGLRYERMSRTDDLPALLAEMFALERAGWKGREGTAIADDAADTRFYTALAERAMAAGALRLALLRDGARLVAFEFDVASGDRVFALKVAYDEAYEAASPGHVLALRHIRDLCEDPAVAWYDQMGNGMTPAAHKLRFADAVHPRFRVTLYRGWRGALVRAADDLRTRAKTIQR